MSPVRWVRLFFARRAATAADAKACELRAEHDARFARIYELPEGSDARGFTAAIWYLDQPLVWNAEDEAKKARAVVAELENPRNEVKS